MSGLLRWGRRPALILCRKEGKYPTDAFVTVRLQRSQTVRSVDQLWQPWPRKRTARTFLIHVSLYGAYTQGAALECDIYILYFDMSVPIHFEMAAQYRGAGVQSGTLGFHLRTLFGEASQVRTTSDTCHVYCSLWLACVHMIYALDTFSQITRPLQARFWSRPALPLQGKQAGKFRRGGRGRRMGRGRGAVRKSTQVDPVLISLFELY
jgi:hypothetical protein